jgi:hypothetical protein
MKVIRLDVYGNISLVDVEFESNGDLMNSNMLFKCELCPNEPNVETHSFLEGYVAYYCANLDHSEICTTPKHPFRHAFLENQEEYRGCIYVAKILESNFTIVPCSNQDKDTISQYVSDFQRRFATREEKSSFCVIA